MKECPKCELCYPDEVSECPADQTATRATLPGTQLLADRYFLQSRLGRGAMGQVYLAKDKKFDTRKVAVKTVRQDILSSEDLQEGEAIVRFEREAQAAASIQHPNTVSVTDFGETTEGVFYLVMEYVEGETLHKLLRREGTLPVKRAVRLLRQIADGVEAAHDLVFAPGAAEAAERALHAGAPVLCDSRMVAAGVTRGRLPAGNEVICTLGDPAIPARAERLGTTRTAAAIDLWAQRLAGALVAIGNAPTALFRLIELIAGGAPRPAAIIGMPVGFVGAAESKEALIESGLAAIVMRGRKGGSAMAAAAINALASEAE